MNAGVESRSRDGVNSRLRRHLIVREKEILRPAFTPAIVDSMNDIMALFIRQP